MFSNQFRRIQIFKIYNLTNISHFRNTKYKLGVAFHQSLLEFKCSIFRCIHIFDDFCNGNKFLQYVFHVHYFLISNYLCLYYFLTENIIFVIADFQCYTVFPRICTSIRSSFFLSAALRKRPASVVSANVSGVLLFFVTWC